MQAHKSIYSYYRTWNWARLECVHIQNSALSVECDRNKFKQDYAPKDGGI